MKFEEIETSILSYSNRFEEERGIKTLPLKLIAGSTRVDWAVYEGPKSDGTSTVFFAYKHKRASDNQWWWMCPSKSHFTGFDELKKIYHEIDCRNISARDRVGDRISDYLGSPNRS